MRRARTLGEDGVSSVEFGIVGGVFMLLVLAIFELGYMVFVQSVLDGSARNAARLIRTGQAQGSGDAQSFFRTALCDGASAVVGCNKISYQSRTFNNWSAMQSALNTPPARDPTTGDPLPTSFAAGTCGQILAVQVMYNYKFFTPWIGSLLGGATNSAFLISTVVFQNEPFCSGV
jgi:Flp pilus assembly protein TadG